MQFWVNRPSKAYSVYSHHTGDAISRQAVPDGEIGEIVMTWRFVPVEYLGDPDRSAQAFGTKHAGERTYRTGDYGYFDSQANLRYVSRRDDQVKVRGFNVRLSVVDDELLSHLDITDCGVIAVSGKQQASRLHGFYVGDVAPRALSAYLNGALPSYMVPSLFVQMDMIPKTVTGKNPPRNVAKNATTGQPKNGCTFDRSACPDLDAGVGAFRCHQDGQFCRCWRGVT